MTEYYIGIDLGTSSVRAFLVDLERKISFVEGETYDVLIPQLGYAEQDPEIWYAKTAEVIRRVISQSGVAPEQIRALSFSGQMHGLVALDEAGAPVMNAAIWLDQRSGEAIREMYEILGEDYVTAQTQNRISAGFMLATLYWMKTRREDLYRRIAKVMMPKDYIKYRLSGAIATDPSDAAGSLAYDNEQLCWATPMLEKLGLNPLLLPDCLPSAAVVGTITDEAAARTGLRKSTLVVNGGADQCMQAIGNGIVRAGVFASNIGTAGQISTTVDQMVYDRKLRTNSFAHAIPGRWNVMGACLNSGISLKWIARQILQEDDYDKINQMVAARPLGSDGLFFLPYLTGERTPHMNPKARGVFLGLTLDHGRADLARAVMEGVVFALKDCLNVVLDLGIPCERIIAAGGGARSDVWLQMQADIFEHDVLRSASKEQACLGAAITAAIGAGKFADYEAACAKCIDAPTVVFHPIEQNAKKYAEMYPIFREIYQANKGIFEQIGNVFCVN